MGHNYKYEASKGPYFFPPPPVHRPVKVLVYISEMLGMYIFHLPL